MENKQRKIKLCSGAWQKDLEMTVVIVDEQKFKKEMAEVNDFFEGAERRTDKFGSAEMAGLTLFAAECFQQVAFNNLLGERYLEEKFDWDSRIGGIEGYPSFADMGIKLEPLDSWHIDADEIEITELSQ